MDFEKAKRMFRHRYTCEHIPRWAIAEAKKRRYYAPQYRTDREWFDNTVFTPGSRYCESSNASFPLGNKWAQDTMQLFLAGELADQTSQAGKLVMLADGANLPPGFPIVATGFRHDVTGVTLGRTYIAINGTEADEDHVFCDLVTFVDNMGRIRSAHATRFSIYRGKGA